MCRLLYLPACVRPPIKVLTRWLVSLEKSFGGDGCGYATRKVSRKGLALTAEASAEMIKKAKGDLIWHTRRVSCGPKTDALCHPFPTGEGQLVHNGHWQTGAFTASMLEGTWSDTMVGAKCVEIHGWDHFTKQCNSGVWLHLTKEGVQVHFKSGSLWVEEDSGALCSEPCMGWGVWNEVAFGTYDVGEKIEIREPEPEKVFEKDSLLWDRLGLPRLSAMRA